MTNVNDFDCSVTLDIRFEIGQLNNKRVSNHCIVFPYVDTYVEYVQIEEKRYRIVSVIVEAEDRARARGRSVIPSRENRLFRGSQTMLKRLCSRVANNNGGSSGNGGSDGSGGSGGSRVAASCELSESVGLTERLGAYNLYPRRGAITFSVPPPRRVAAAPPLSRRF